MTTYSIKKRITKKYANMTAVIEEYNDGKFIHQRVRRVMKGTRNFGEVILYGMSPIERGGCYDMKEVIKSVKSDLRMYYFED